MGRRRRGATSAALGAALLLAAAAPRGARAIGTGWACASQPGPFQVWIQELHVASTGAPPEDQVEIAALAAVNTTWARVDGACLLQRGAVWVVAGC